MHRVSQLVGKPIVTSESGEHVGKTTDLLISQDGSHIVGFVVSGGILGSEKGVLPYDQVHSLGGDVIVANGVEPVLDRNDWRARHVEAIRSSDFTHKRVVSTDGVSMGQLKDLCVDEPTGRIGGYEIAQSRFLGLGHRCQIVEPSGDVVIGKDVLLIPEGSTGPRT